MSELSLGSLRVPLSLDLPPVEVPDAVRTGLKWAGIVVGAGACTVMAYHTVAAIVCRPAPWFSFISYGKTKMTTPYSFEDPRFYPRAQLPWLGQLEQHWEEIRDELQAFLRTMPVPFVPYFRPDLVNKAGAWKTLGLKAWGLEDRAIMQHFPKTCKVLRDLPVPVVGVSFNHLEARGVVKAHQGNTNAIARVHLGLKVPKNKTEDCYFKVSSDIRPWREGQAFGFCDAHWHTAFNGADESRYILLFDAIHPEYTHMTTYICARVVADLALQYFTGRIRLIQWLTKVAPTPTRLVLYNTFVPVFHVLLLINPDFLSFFS
ncbi:hypothetical protein PTSG_05986 [Salpingoeca rosetta]|uniref:Aspartyl/asparaginy/proline hydroxylase domain-containing protein n=1 Tax=Salpingoeca rosetta (strain ATCC 50818 / BSB-021) TaxID=946362 RepID=F2UDC6_SALR5|nr:uncharacterized protein PTSG_05986 [Salpingoeca rosetta]EGD74621.1 hypothetical protein PTSG_05986 [Salpingoeca rosetta]|eukprot:XP_004992878.1 hypothetical protein PTSG_05986 [Salpingoeca rosetta]